MVLAALIYYSGDSRWLGVSSVPCSPVPGPRAGFMDDPVVQLSEVHFVPLMSAPGRSCPGAKILALPLFCCTQLAWSVPVGLDLAR